MKLVLTPTAAVAMIDEKQINSLADQALHSASQGLLRLERKKPAKVGCAQVEMPNNEKTKSSLHG